MIVFGAAASAGPVGPRPATRRAHSAPGRGAERAALPGAPEGRLDPGLGRWLWLVKWLLLIPHFIVLASCGWRSACVTVVAFFAILFTGRYPRGCSTSTSACCAGRWRVTFYAYGALGTDRYPPFSLGAAPTTRPPSRSPTPSTSPAAWCWSSGGCWPSPSTSWSASSAAASSGGWAGGGGEHWGWGSSCGGAIGVLVLFAAVCAARSPAATRAASSTSWSVSTGGSSASSRTSP